VNADQPVIFSVSDFVASANQTFEYVYPLVQIEGELANFRVSKNRWVYFDLKDELASIRFFGTVYQLKMPLEDGMMLRVAGTPKLHPQYGFSITIQQIELIGEGTIKRAATILEAKLRTEGLFDESRKRSLPYPPVRIGLITSGESAAYADFAKILKVRWAGLDVLHTDVQVQGVDAPAQIVRAVNTLNELPEVPEVLVLVRGGGSPEDLQAFSDERVVRAVAGSRIPTLVGVGHESDVSLVELAADLRASTPSNAAELLVPDKAQVMHVVGRQAELLAQAVVRLVERQKEQLYSQKATLNEALEASFRRAKQQLEMQQSLLAAYNPSAALERGYAIIRKENQVLKRGGDVGPGDIVTIEMQDVRLEANVVGKHKKEKQRGKSEQ
jgi:exodeoxyribonuclease VII large subunit